MLLQVLAGATAFHDVIKHLFTLSSYLMVQQVLLPAEVPLKSVPETMEEKMERSNQRIWKCSDMLSVRDIYSRLSRSFTARGSVKGGGAHQGYKANKLKSH